MYDIELGEYFSVSKMLINLDIMNLNSVPVLDVNFKLPSTVQDLLDFADSKSELNKDFDREGIVIRTHDKKISFKVISNKFLLNEK
jgi:hypothetical protein